MLEYKSAGKFCSKRPKRNLAQLQGNRHNRQLKTSPILQNRRHCQPWGSISMTLTSLDSLRMKCEKKCDTGTCRRARLLSELSEQNNLVCTVLIMSIHKKWSASVFIGLMEYMSMWNSPDVLPECISAGKGLMNTSCWDWGAVSK